jgi:crotonobetainyl-CoA:carnitine CoA-transferase CaiB-like acyl-CoA transferase
LRFSAAPNLPYRPSPGLGRHNGEVLEQLGFSGDEVTRLAETGSLGRLGEP